MAEYEFPVSAGYLNLSGTNEVWFQNNSSSDPDVSVELYLSMGDFVTHREDYQPVLDISRTGTMTTITFAAQAGITNTLQGTYSLIPATWTTIQTVVGADSTVTITDTDAAATKFYQVILGPVVVPAAVKPDAAK